MPKTIFDVTLAELMPFNMASDSNIAAICAAFDAMTQMVTSQIAVVSVLDNIGNQPADVTDLLAVEHQTPYYNQDLPLANRQSLLANSGRMNSILGTKEAVEETVKTAYGPCKMQEWFEYTGQPGHFRMLFVNNPVSFGATIGITVNGHAIQSDVPPQLINGHTLVPVSVVAKALGCQVSWDANTQTASVTQGTNAIEIPIDSTKIKVNGIERVIDQPAIVINNRTMVPLRVIGQALGANVSWNGSTNTVEISENKDTKTPTQQTGSVNNNSSSDWPESQTQVICPGTSSTPTTPTTYPGIDSGTYSTPPWKQ